MLETPHVIVAAAIAYKVGNPAIALPLALGSHFILEKVPHWNPHLNTELRKYGKLTSVTMRIIFLDSSLALLSGFYLASLAMPDINKFLIIILACLLGIMPDLVEAPYFLWKKKNKMLERLVGFQKSIQNDTTPLPGLFTQLVTILAVIIWISK